MQDYGKRFLIALLVALCISLLFIGGTYSQAAEMKKELPGEFIWPAEGVITDYFGTRGGTHKGIDIAAPLNTEIKAAGGGAVSKAYTSNTYGNVIFINHEGRYETVYAHLNKILVQEGDSVKKGQIIGKMGTTGYSTGVHLHFEIHQHKWTVQKEFALDPIAALERSHMPAAGQPEASGNRTMDKKALDSYVVKAGDTLWRISKQAHMSVEELKEMNGLTSDFVQAGQVLKLAAGN
ncbi:murein DD-endopeptidase MepM/ murein hydrolase activator NlpD [Peribacillus deserti]|uniref:Murein DD-endopeptidase MepM/ murein hydrolase activator NlpD n=1 Tax=Peribacillus deserti TaxID=673318 RepID=A0ABS2QNJ1_9BACI|nr:peptidoglycan DD-metalloendopeptidase family protein [Peribacillus deserti]MBM7694738.1 murein DD-endopeptidase MepM/ murein hydrolase activator NlpD [Peribacillus deserti]